MAPGVSRAACGNEAFNIIRATECEAYTTDFGKLKDLRDKRIDAIQAFTDKNTGGRNDLITVLNAATEQRSIMERRMDLALWPDKSMWEARGCEALPVCMGEKPKGQFIKPSVQPEDLEVEKPAVKPAKRKPRNSRTGGDYCGPRDTRNGYCD